MQSPLCLEMFSRTAPKNLNPRHSELLDLGSVERVFKGSGIENNTAIS